MFIEMRDERLPGFFAKADVVEPILTVEEVKAYFVFEADAVVDRDMIGVFIPPGMSVEPEMR
jgi:hypothetical protein